MADDKFGGSRNLDAIELRKAAQELRAIWVVGNE